MHYFSIANAESQDFPPGGPMQCRSALATCRHQYNIMTHSDCHLHALVLHCAATCSTRILRMRLRSGAIEEVPAL